MQTNETNRHNRERAITVCDFERCAPRLSIIIPCRNEEGSIGGCLESIVANDYPKEDLEVLVIDGCSEDGTRSIVGEYQHRYSFVRLIHNPNRNKPSALNIGIREARGDTILRMDAHARIAPDYIRRCENALLTHDAANVGGKMITLPGGKGVIAQGIAAAISHPFGVGNSAFRTAVDKPTYVDTVFGGCYQSQALAKVGWFNEKLINTQDIEYNIRLRKAGYKILLLPDIVCYYYARPDLGSFCVQNFRNGLWTILPIRLSDFLPSWRHLAPLMFVLALLGSRFSRWLTALA